MSTKSINDIENAYNVIKHITKGTNHKVKEKLCREFCGKSSEKTKLFHFKYITYYQIHGI